ncbi:MAG: SDR family oxidoreductase [Clostridia bacterium]|nr:SDR family oxidoreductase [Clostridia bacterium]MBR3295086.1 SDR family oxidoreductase [Clostridia bacterium]
MKVYLAGAFGHLGTDVLKALVEAGHEVVAADLKENKLPELEGKYEFKAINVTDPKTLEGTIDGCDAVITTVGLTTGSATVTNYDIDYKGNLNILGEAKKAGVKNFVYISVIKCDEQPDIPMLDAKAKFEAELKKSGLTYVIHRPTGYFYDIVKVFRPMIEKGSVSLLGKEDHKCNVVHTPDFGRFIVEHMLDVNRTYEVGGKETYTYAEIANMCFEAAGKQGEIKRAPVFIFGMLIFINKLKKNGKDALIKFSRFTLTHDLVGKDVAGDSSFKEYIKDSFRK